MHQSACVMHAPARKKQAAANSRGAPWKRWPRRPWASMEEPTSAPATLATVFRTDNRKFIGCCASLGRCLVHKLANTGVPQQPGEAANKVKNIHLVSVALAKPTNLRALARRQILAISNMRPRVICSSQGRTTPWPSSCRQPPKPMKTPSSWLCQPRAACIHSTSTAAKLAMPSPLSASAQQHQRRPGTLQSDSRRLSCAFAERWPEAWRERRLPIDRSGMYSGSQNTTPQTTTMPKTCAQAKGAAPPYWSTR
mmetsp:Transcript_120747/g.352643  ORF Transcript_120747/g.352643 Transcript_120747/m.352643 type:complete len:253 (+) Transcript_120747:124-882(+)